MPVPRAPYGSAWSSSALFAVTKSLGFKTIQWDVDPVDWSRPGTAAIEERVLSAVHPGAIVLQHDGGGDRSETLAALPDEIQTRCGRPRLPLRDDHHRCSGMKLLYRLVVRLGEVGIDRVDQRQRQLEGGPSSAAAVERRRDVVRRLV